MPTRHAASHQEQPRRRARGVPFTPAAAGLAVTGFVKGASALLVLVAAGGILVTGPVFGQERVRLTLPRDTLVGVVTRMSADELELTLDGGGSRVYLRGDVLRMERGAEHTQGHLGYLLGSALGTGSGVALWSVLDRSDLVRGNHAIAAIPLGFCAGGFIGYRIGASSTVVKWETVPEWTVYWMMPQRRGPPGAIRSGGAGVRVGVRVPFR